MMSALNQSCSRPRSSISCNAPTQRTSRTSPKPSTGSFTFSVSALRSTVHAVKAQIAATGTLMKKIQCQPQLSEMVPPRIGPKIGAVSVVIAQIPIVIACLSLGKTRSSRV